MAVSLSTASARAQAPARPSWGPFERLQGTWVADSGSGGHPGAAARAGETWTQDLNGRVLLRRDYSEYPASSDHVAFRHEGLMVIAPSPTGGFNAWSYDNEGHVIQYGVLAHDSAVVFTSTATPGQPQFRLTYSQTGRGYSVQFEIAAPNAPGQFRMYVAGGLHRAP
jgi:hypothetical protein